MTNKIVVTSTSFYRCIFRIENNFVSNIFFEDLSNKNIKVNDIYKAVVKEIVPSLGGAFVYLGNSKKAFLKISKHNQKIIVVGNKIVVQVIKGETFPNKLAVVSTDILLKGALLIYKPMVRNIIFPKKLTQQDKDDILNNIGYQKDLSDYGLIIRSLYKHNLLSQLVIEFLYLEKIWDKIKKCTKVGLIHQDYFLEHIILSNSKRIPEEVICSSTDEFDYISKILKRYKFLKISNTIHTQKEHILDHYDIINFLDYTSMSKIEVQDNINIVFYEQDSFNYIDVNFLGDLSMSSIKENSAYAVNMRVLPDIVSSIISRNLSGQIIIDLLKITNKKLLNEIVIYTKQLFNNDENKVSILGFSHLGFLEISRQKISDSFSLITKNSFYYNIFILIMEIERLANQSSKVIINISSSHLQKFMDIAQLEIDNINSKLFDEIEFVIDNDCSIPKLQVHNI